MKNKRRDFLKKSFLGTAGIVMGGVGLSAKSNRSVTGVKNPVEIKVSGLVRFR